MNPGPTSERVFDALKADILSGDLAPGMKLEPHAFAERLASSVTPVRDALHRLAGERLVDLRTSEGFYVPFVTEPGLRDLYSWNGQLVRMVVHSWSAKAPSIRADGLPADIGRATRAFFDLFGGIAPNGEYQRQLDSASDRLAAARMAEERVFPDREAELRAMAVAFDHARPAELLKLVMAYHRRRLNATPAIVRAIYRA